MSRSLEVLFAPAEFEALDRRDLSATVCVVFDVLRATSSILTALANGASGVVAVNGITEALRIRDMRPNVLLAGERDGVRIRGHLSGGVDFHLGNSPREFTPKVVAGRLIVTTTTNGTRALRACTAAREVWIGALLNLGAMAAALAQNAPERLLLVCSGTHDQSAEEDVLAAGGLCDRLWSLYEGGQVSDSARMARHLFKSSERELTRALSQTRNGRRLMGLPELREDVHFCSALDSLPITAQAGKDNVIRRVSG